MKNHEASVFIFIASIIVGILISMNLSFSNEGSKPILNAQQYAEASNSKNKLLNEISDLQTQYNKYYSKLSKYMYSDQDKKEIISEIENEVQNNKLLLGKTDVKGSGIKIELDDASSSYISDPFEYEMRIIHDKDVLQIINDLRNAGAEAIAINGQRIINKSDVICNGPFLRVNGVKIAVPFYINAIGDKDVLENYMMRDDNHLKTLMLRKIYVHLTPVDEITIPAYIGELKSDYVKSKSK